MKQNTLIKSAIILGFGTFFSKLLGAVYRLPLTNILGGYGLGLYQTVFPLYAILLTFSGGGVPSALAKLISQKLSIKNGNTFIDSKNSYLFASIKLLSIVGIIFSLLILCLSFLIAKIQGNTDAGLSYITISPAIFFVAIISCFRGYFQGQNNFKPTSISQIIEQSIKLIFGLSFAYIFRNNIPLAVAFCTLAISISEVVALIFLILSFNRQNKGISLKTALLKRGFSPLIKEVVLTSIPITLIGIAIPLSQMIDSFLIINILSTYLNNATSLYGLFSGAVATIVSLPTSLLYCISSASIPALSRLNVLDERVKLEKKAISITFILSLFATFLVLVFRNIMIKILFSGLGGGERDLIESMLKINCVSIIFLSVLETENAILIARGRLYFPLIGEGVGITLKVILSVLLLFDRAINIYGAVYAQIACYFVASLINLFLIIGDKNGCKIYKNRQYST